MRSPVTSTDDGVRVVSIYANGPLFSDSDFAGAIIALKANYPHLKEDTADNNMFFSLLKTAAARKGFTGKRLKEAVMEHILNSRYAPKVSEITDFDRGIEVLGYRKVQDMSWPHDPIVMIHLPNGNVEFAWKKDVLPEYGYDVEDYETPSQHQKKLKDEEDSMTPDEVAEMADRIKAKLKDIHVYNVNDVLT